MSLRCNLSALLATFAVACAVCRGAPAQTTAPSDPAGGYEPKAREVMAYLQKTYWDATRGVYTKSARDRTPDYVWREAAAFSALAGASRHDPQTYRPVMDRFFRSLDQYWDTKTPVPAYEPAPTKGNGHDKYYDDNAWVIITFAEAYQVTGEKAYLNRAIEVAQFVASGWDDQLGGGIWWHQAHKDNSKNTCANGPAAEGYLQLARFLPPDEAKPWVQAALKAVDWTREKLQDGDGLFDDRVIVASGEVKKGKLTYNSALMLRSELGLYRATGRQEYLEDAGRIGKAADWFTDKRTGVYRDPLKWSHFMVEADLEFYRATGEEYAMRRARTNADAYYSAWKKNPPEDMMSNAAIARILWLLADTETEQGRAFWARADKPRFSGNR